MQPLNQDGVPGWPFVFGMKTARPGSQWLLECQIQHQVDERDLREPVEKEVHSDSPEGCRTRRGPGALGFFAGPLGSVRTLRVPDAGRRAPPSFSHLEMAFAFSEPIFFFML